MKLKRNEAAETPVTLSEEWATLSEALCSPEFIQSLSYFFVAQKVRSLLECACGDGFVLASIAKNIHAGIGIDSDTYLIQRAKRKHHCSNIEFKELDILRIDTEESTKRKQFDAVMLRGNSITAIGAWGSNKETFDAKKCERYIREALLKMWGKVRHNGFLYLDVNRQQDIDKGNYSLEINTDNVHLSGEISIDREYKRRDVFGHGTVNGKSFTGGSSSYLISPDELQSLINELLHPKDIWTPLEVKETTYQVLCIRK